MTDAMPAGFEPFPKFGGFIENSGPFFRTALVDGTRRYGFRAEAKHANPNGVIHGGVLVTFVDTCMGQAVVDSTGRYCATISLNTEFVSGVAVDCWVEAETKIVRATRSLVFLRADVTSDGQVLMTASSVWKLLDGPS